MDILEEPAAGVNLDFAQPAMNAAAPVDPPAHPVAHIFTPKLKTKGHEKICELVLPMLLTVMSESRYGGSAPREQLREALKRDLAGPDSKHLTLSEEWIKKGNASGANTLSTPGKGLAKT